MQWRMSPGGGMPRSCRSLPEPPPSSATVTMAVRFLVWLFRPRSMVDSPVPPPMATTRGPCSRRRSKQLDSVMLCPPYARVMSRWFSVAA